MIYLTLLSTHPVLAASVMVAAIWLLSALWTVTAAAIPAVLYGRYRGQVVTWVDSAGCFAVAAVVLCAPVFVWMVM